MLDYHSKMAELFGIKTDERKQAEEANRISLDSDLFVGSDKEPYSEHLQKPIEIHSGPGKQYMGIYRGLSKRNDLVLFPTLTWETYRIAGEEEEKKTRAIYSWMQRPAFIVYPSVNAVIPVRQEYLDALVSTGGLFLVEK